MLDWLLAFTAAASLVSAVVCVVWLTVYILR